MFRKESNAYQPPRGYWEEVVKAEKSLYKEHSFRPDPSSISLISRIGEMTFYARWIGLKENEVSTWIGRRIRLGLGSTSTLYAMEFVTVDPLVDSYGLDESNKRREAVLYKRYLYTASRGGSLALALQDYELNCDNPEPNEKRSLIGRFAAGLELIRESQPLLTADDYDSMLAELQRGASGEYSINPLSSEL